MTHDATTARDAAVGVARTLRDAGRVAYFAGGCVRDELLGHEPKDYDVATDAPPDDVARLFRRTREVGKAFGVMLVHLHGHVIEIATFRAEGDYSDKRRPDAVTFADARADAHRRDFTINALFLDPLDAAADDPRGRVIDFVGGREDLLRGVVRAVGDPEARLAEDHLRALRAVRFAARLGFTIDPPTAAAITRHARELEGVSRERIGDEVRRMLVIPTRADAVRLLQALDLDGPVLDEASLPDAPATLLSGLAPGAALHAALAAWALDRRAYTAGADPATIAHEAADDVGRRWRRALCLANDERDALRAALLGYRTLRLRWSREGVAFRKRAAASHWFDDALGLVDAAGPEDAARIRRDRDALAGDGVGLAPPPLLTGDHHINAGFRPGPAFAACLDAVYDRQLAGDVSDLGDALAEARRRLDPNRAPGPAEEDTP